MQFPEIDGYQNEKLTLSLLCNFGDLHWRWLHNSSSIEYNFFIIYFEANL